MCNFETSDFRLNHRESAKSFTYNRIRQRCGVAIRQELNRETLEELHFVESKKFGDVYYAPKSKAKSGA